MLVQYMLKQVYYSLKLRKAGAPVWSLVSILVLALASQIYLASTGGVQVGSDGDVFQAEHTAVAHAYGEPHISRDTSNTKSQDAGLPVSSAYYSSLSPVVRIYNANKPNYLKPPASLDNYSPRAPPLFP